MFLDTAPFSEEFGLAMGTTEFQPFFLGLLATFLIAFIVIVLFLWIYTSIAFSSIAKKGKSKYSPGIAWIPIVGPSLIASDLAKMHWWPLLLLLGFWIPFIGTLLGIVFAVFFIVWNWKMFEKLKRPGWWAIFYVIPVLSIVYLVFLGIAAWGKK